jgi:hypothetical protein
VTWWPVIAMLTCVGLLAVRPWTETRQLVIVLVLGLLMWAGCTAAVQKHVPDTGDGPGGTS